MMSETIELLGKGLYTNIPDKLTLKAFPTVTELDYVGSEDFESTMLNKIFPQCIEEDIDFNQLLEIDFQWICRCLRFLNYGPYFTTNTILCSKCGTVRLECQVDLRRVDCKPIPADFSPDIVIKKDDLIDYKHDIHMRLLTIGDVMTMRDDKLFRRSDGTLNSTYARLCYSITAMGQEKNMVPPAAKIEIERKLSPADYKILVAVSQEMTDFGLRGGGRCSCPQCHSKGAAFIALADDKFFRPTVGDLRQGRNDRTTRWEEDPSRAEEATV